MNTERSLLLGLLAFQNNFISQVQLLAAFSGWIGDKSKPIAEFLVIQGALSTDAVGVMERMVDLHLERFSGVAAKSLASLQGVTSIRVELEKLAAEDSAALNSLSHLPVISNDSKMCNLTDYKTVLQGETKTETTGTSGVNRFRIIREYAKGGLGVVFVAEDRELRREVALKQIRADREDYAEYRSKFSLEAEVTAQLEHPGIVPVYGLGTDERGRPYYAMRFIRGENLQSRLQNFHAARKEKKAPFDGPELRGLLRRFVDVCDAIDYAHYRGVLHRDLKPGNVMLGKHGETLVVDWGLAKPMAEKVEEDMYSTRNVHSELPIAKSESESGVETRYGSFVGTPAYAPPEQVLGQLDKIGPASDVYSLGAILYELLTGQVPISGATIEEVITKSTTGDFKPPRMIDAAIPKPLEAICRKAMSIATQDRYQTAGELKQEIESWIDDSPVSSYREPLPVRAARFLRNHPAFVAGTAATLLLGIAALIGYSIISRQHNGELVKKNIEIEGKTEQLQLKKNHADRSALLAQESEAQAVVLGVRLAQESKSFRVASSRRDLATGVMAMQHNSREIGAQYLTSALKLAEVEPKLQQRVGIAALGYLGEITPPLLYHENIRKVFYDQQGSFIFTVAAPPHGSYSALRVWDALSSAPVTEWLEFNTSLCSDLTFTSDNRKFALLTGLGEIQIRNIYDGKLLTSIQAFEPKEKKWSQTALNFYHHGFVFFDSKGKNIIAGAESQPIRIFESTNGKFLAELPRSLSFKDAYAYHRGKGHLALSSGSNLTIWETETFLKVSDRSLTGTISKKGIEVLQFSPDGDVLATASDREIRLLKTSEDAISDKNFIAKSPVHQLHFNATSDRLIATGWNSVELWNLESKELIANFVEEGKSHGWEDCHTVISADGTIVGVDLGKAHSFRIFRTKNGQLEREFPNRVSSAAFDPHRSRIAVAVGQEVHLFRPFEASPRARIQIPEIPVDVLRFSGDGEKLASGWHDNQLRVLRTSDLSILSELRHGKHVNDPTEIFGLSPVVRSLQFSADDEQLVSVSKDGTVKSWDLDTEAELAKGIQIDDEFARFEYISKHNLFLTYHNRLSAWDGKDHRSLDNFLKVPEFKSTNTIATCISGGRFAVNRNYSVDLYESNRKTSGDLECGKILTINHRLPENEWIRFIEFNPVGDCLAMVGDTFIAIYAIREDRLLAEFRAHRKSISSVKFTPDGKKAVTTAFDFKIRAWDVDSGVQIGTDFYPQSSNSTIGNQISVSDQLVFSLEQGKMVVWDLETLQPIQHIADKSPITCFAIDPKSRFLATGNQSGSVALWELNDRPLPTSPDSRAALLSLYSHYNSANDGSAVLLYQEEIDARWESVLKDQSYLSAFNDYLERQEYLSNLECARRAFAAGDQLCYSAVIDRIAARQQRESVKDLSTLFERLKADSENSNTEFFARQILEERWNSVKTGDRLALELIGSELLSMKILKPGDTVWNLQFAAWLVMSKGSDLEGIERVTQKWFSSQSTFASGDWLTAWVLASQGGVTTLEVLQKAAASNQCDAQDLMFYAVVLQNAGQAEKALLQVKNSAKLLTKTWGTKAQLANRPLVERIPLEIIMDFLSRLHAELNAQMRVSVTTGSAKVSFVEREEGGQPWDSGFSQRPVPTPRSWVSSFSPDAKIIATVNPFFKRSTIGSK